VVAKRHHVCARGQELVRELRRQPRAVGGVLAVHDAEIDGELLLQLREALLDGAAARRAEDVGDEEDFQGIESVAAG